MKYYFECIRLEIIVPDQAICRVDKQPEDQVIFDSIINASDKRIEELSNFIDILKRIEGNYSIFLNGEWGIGKTFFVKQISMILLADIGWCRDKFKNIDASEIRKKILDKEGKASTNDAKCYPIYYNAWEFDYAIDPIFPLVACLINEFEGYSDISKQEKGNSEVISSLIGSLNFEFGILSLNVGEAIKSLKKDDYLDAFNHKKELRQRIRSVFKEIYKGSCKRFVLFVDELDRCRPEYAVKVLETLKFIFDQDNLTIVFSVNSNALGSSISSWYGNGFDGYRYLKRFYDRSFGIRSFDVVQYLSNFGIKVGYESYITRSVEHHGITARDINRCIDDLISLNQVSDGCLTCLDSSINSQIGYVPSQVFERFVFGAFAVGLVFMFDSKVGIEKKLVLEGTGFQLVLQWFINEEFFLKGIIDLHKAFFNDDYYNSDDMHESRVESIGSSRLEKLYNLMFGKEEDIVKSIDNLGARECISKVRNGIRRIFIKGTFD